MPENLAQIGCEGEAVRGGGEAVEFLSSLKCGTRKVPVDPKVRDKHA